MSTEIWECIGIHPDGRLGTSEFKREWFEDNERYKKIVDKPDLVAYVVAHDGGLGWLMVIYVKKEG